MLHWYVFVEFESFCGGCVVVMAAYLEFEAVVFALEVLFRACTVCLTRIVVSICMFGYTCMFFGGVVDLSFTNVFFGCVIGRVKEIAE